MADDQNSGNGCVAVGLGLSILAVLGLFLVTLPNWLASGASKAKQSEGRTYVGALNRAQQAYHFEYGEFSTSLVALETGMPTETDRFALATIIVSDGAVQNSGMAKQQGLYSLVGLVWVIDSGEGELTTNRQFCRSIASAHEPEKPIFPRWIRAMFRSQRGVAIYPAETPPAFELPELPARPDVVISCPDGYETER